MKIYSIFMCVFGLLLFLYGLYIINSKNPFVIKLKKRNTRRYYKYVGKTLMILSVSPIFSGLIASIDDTDLILFASQATLIIGFIIGLIISTKYIKR